MSERDFEIGGRKFKLCKIDAFKQFHIVRRLGPLLGELAPALGTFAKSKGQASFLSESEKLDEFAKLLTPLMTGLSKLTDEDANKVLFGLLSSVEIQQMPVGNWARLATDQAIMFSDLELPVLLQAAGRAFAYNLSGFFPAPPHAP